MFIFSFDVIFGNQRTGETETIRKEYCHCDWYEALDQVTAFVKEELKRRFEEIGKCDWYLDCIKSYLA